MGRNRVDFTVAASLSAHHSAQDDFDEERWADLRVRVESLVKEYDDIGAWVYE